MKTLPKIICIGLTSLSIHPLFPMEAGSSQPRRFSHESSVTYTDGRSLYFDLLIHSQPNDPRFQKQVFVNNSEFREILDTIKSLPLAAAISFILACQDQKSHPIAKDFIDLLKTNGLITVTSTYHSYTINPKAQLLALYCFILGANLNSYAIPCEKELYENVFYPQGMLIGCSVG